MEYLGKDVIWLEEVDSTNEEMARRLELDRYLPGGTVIAARDQRNGKGMGVNSWVSEPPTVAVAPRGFNTPTTT